jgi:hypothetical protein
VMAWKVLDQFKVPGRLLGHKREVAWIQKNHNFDCAHSFLFLGGLVFEPRPYYLQIRHSMTQAKPPVHYALVILEMGVCELFSWARWEWRSNLSLPSCWDYKVWALEPGSFAGF